MIFIFNFVVNMMIPCQTVFQIDILERSDDNFFEL